jgi:hypothetical protein
MDLATSRKIRVLDLKDSVDAMKKKRSSPRQSVSAMGVHTSGVSVGGPADERYHVPLRCTPCGADESQSAPFTLTS